MLHIEKVQLNLLEAIQKIAEAAINENGNEQEVINLVLLTQKYLRMLRELERLKYLLIPEQDYPDEDLFPRWTIDPEVEELADLLGYDDDLEYVTTDQIWEKTGH